MDKEKKNFLYEFNHKIRKKLNSFTNKLLYPVRKLKTYHEVLKQMDNEGEKNPYSAFVSWLLDIVEYGLTAYYVYLTILATGITQLIMLPFAIGITRWWILKFIKDIKTEITN